MKALLLTCLILFLFGSPSFSDTVKMIDGTLIVGFVVDEYKDRIVISTYEGEKTFPRDKIKEIIYQQPEKELMVRGDEYRNRNDFKTALVYYKKAYEVNPHLDGIVERIDFVEKYLARQKEGEVVKVRRAKPEGALAKEIGIYIKKDGSFMKVTEVVKDSPAFKAGLRKDDVLISAWGTRTGYMSGKDVATLLLQLGPREVSFSIDREIKLVPNSSNAETRYVDSIGAKFEMRDTGLTVTYIQEDGPAYRAGLKNGDRIVSVNGESTRYMPLGEVRKSILRNWKENKELTLTLRRRILISEKRR